ncbi:hypothetical protein [Lentibacter sp.]|uniref:hypothetical protein n=1 Tax=Lentibacter sp. TaxID=2024994 RepID=UPI003F6C19D8
MKFALNTLAAFALTATTAFAAGVEGPAIADDEAVANPTIGEVITVISPSNTSSRSGSEAIDGAFRANLFEGASEIDTTPGGAHFR